MRRNALRSTAAVTGIAFFGNSRHINRHRIGSQGWAPHLFSLVGTEGRSREQSRVRLFCGRGRSIARRIEATGLLV
jgi:hypothetical protein